MTQPCPNFKGGVDKLHSCILVQHDVSILSSILSYFYNLGVSFFEAYHIAYSCFITLRPRQNGRHFADDTFKYIFLNEYVIISAKISLKFVPKGPINNIPALVQIMDWHQPGDKPLSEPMMVSLLEHICVTRPQWVIWSIEYFAWYVSIDYPY